MDRQAQLRLKKDEVEKLGAAAYVVVPADLYRTKMFKEKNLIRFLVEFEERAPGPLDKMESIVLGTALADPARSAAALYGVVRPGRYVDPGWFVIDRTGKITYTMLGWPSGKSELNNVERVLEELKKAAR